MLWLQSPRCEGITTNILRLLPTMMSTDPTSRPHAWMLSEYFSQILLMSESERTDTAQGTRILGELMSSKRPHARRDVSSRIATRIAGDASAPPKTVRGTWVSLSERSHGPDEITTAIKSAVKPADIASMPIGHDVSDASTPSHPKDKSSNLGSRTATALRHLVSSSSRGTSSRRPKHLVEDQVASFRLNNEIVQEQLLRMFPEIPVAEFKIRVG